MFTGDIEKKLDGIAIELKKLELLKEIVQLLKDVKVLLEEQRDKKSRDKGRA
ncbi:MAG: hypothetical protein HYT82_02235 [Candidatus Harrisonbacteria bacterium]|nr:hypothetical protein [Candidatus Harrisonbacteria bacterium]MBI2406041.1 hypothetical protein [Candidatus Harrisonbacteria bacterium]MBI2604159.1 hypothetical protein [Candidatus Harrisonbacteria bacterium]